jgi:hypothetical protein
VVSLAHTRENALVTSPSTDAPGAHEVVPEDVARCAVHVDGRAGAPAVHEGAGVLVSPGVYLGTEGHLRLGSALGPARTAQASDRIAELLTALSAR